MPPYLEFLIHFIKMYPGHDDECLPNVTLVSMTTAKVKLSDCTIALALALLIRYKVIADEQI